MAYTITSAIEGMLPITGIDAGVVPPNNFNTGSSTAVPSSPLFPGMIVTGRDPTYQGAEFILLLGVAGTAVGAPVIYNQTTFQTALALVGTGLPQPIAIAMSANLAGTWGWYQISGLAVALKTTASLLASTAVGVTSVGYIGATATALEIEGALVAALATTAATTVQLVINRPHMMGRTAA